MEPSARGIADQRTKQEVVLVSHIVARAGLPFRAADDPAFARWAIR